MKIETLKLWENREDVELTTFLTMPDPFIPNPVFKPAIIVCPGGAYQTCPRHGNPMLADDMNVPVMREVRPSKEILEKWSPINHVTKEMPATFLGAAVDDGMVPSIQSIKMAEKLHETGVPYELHMFQFGDHGFSLGRNLFEPFREDKAHACAQWVPLAKTFLMHQIAEETTEKEKNPFAQFEQK